MRDKLGPGTTLSYCTNVHPGDSLRRIRAELERNATEVQSRIGGPGRLGLGLCAPRIVSRHTRPKDLIGDLWTRLRRGDSDDIFAFSRFLETNSLEVVTCNAFPFQGFHQAVVKHRVYEPDWADPDRFRHAYAAAALMLVLVTDCESISISNLPIGWPTRTGDSPRVRQAAQQLRRFAEELGSLEKSHGSDRESAPRITLDLEPEPGCILDTCDDVIAFFDEHLPEEIHRQHIGVCHDVCHAAVMFEDQREVLRRYAEAGIRVNKVQISSALDVDVRTIGVEAAIKHLRPFAEPRYLHQTGFMTGDPGSGSFELIEDLPEALERLEQGDRPDRLSVHFHVPVYLDSIGPLGTTNNQIAEAVAAAREYHDTKHFEVETYAWGVLPDHLKRDTLAAGIADELKWVLHACGDEPSP